MELQEFVSETLKQINVGVLDASKETTKNNKFRYYVEDSIEFDVAITVTDAKTNETGGKLNVAAYIFGASAGTSNEHAATRSEVSRIRFKVSLSSTE